MAFNINWWGLAAWAVDKIPFEKMVKPPSDTQSLKELQGILSKAPVEPAQVTPSGPVIIREKVEVKPNSNTTSQVSTAETVAYQNREMGKVLIQMERHASQGLRIGGKPCDCMSKHLVDLEALAEETITMVTNPGIYQQVTAWVREIAPKTTVEANESGQYIQEYAEMARQARDFRKELLGTLDYKVLFNGHKSTSVREKVTELEVPPELAREQVTKPDINLTDSLTAEAQPVVESVENMPKNMPEQEVEDTRPISANGTVCEDLKSMVDWVTGPDPEKCRTCMLTITVPWYFEELEAVGEKELVEDLEVVQKEGDPLKVAAALDQIKEQVKPEVKQRLQEFDCASQSFEN